MEGYSSFLYTEHTLKIGYGGKCSKLLFLAQKGIRQGGKVANLSSTDESAFPCSGRPGVLPPETWAAADRATRPALPVGRILGKSLRPVQHPEYDSYRLRG